MPSDATEEQPTTTGTMSKRMAKNIALIAAARGMLKWEVLEKYCGHIIDRECAKALREQHELGEAGA